MNEPAKDNTPPATSMAKPGGQRIGEKLVKLGLVTVDQIEVALHEKNRSGKMLGTVLVELGFISDITLSAVLSQSAGIGTFDPKSAMSDPELVRRVPKDIAVRYRAMPLSADGVTTLVAMVDPYDVVALDQLRRYLPVGAEITPLVATSAQLAEAIDLAYGYEMSIDGIMRELRTGQIDPLSITENADGYKHPIVRLVSALLFDAVKQNASDLHFEPEALFVRLRYRIDGSMVQVMTFHKDHWPAISHRIKIIAGMNIADKLNPQDGRYTLTVGGRHVDFRAATLPGMHGENIVMRILDRARSLIDVNQLGFTEHNIQLLKKLLQRPEGIMIVTGPTGSGKTTTLYSVLNYINTVERNIMTLEDPVEYELPLIRQTNVREATGLGFAEGVRAIMRQDPDIIFIGEVRDAETASMAQRAAMTGHQVFTTLHTNDAYGAIPRLFDLGLQPGMIAGNIIGILAQRLVRVLCTHCKEAYSATPEECTLLGLDRQNPPTLYRGKGCAQCRHTGYKGRVALVEILPVTEALDNVIAQGGLRQDVKKTALEQGFRPMILDGIDKILSGQISVNSLARAVDLNLRLSMITFEGES